LTKLPSQHDLLVIGAGPSGLLAAKEAAHSGVSVTVLEEHEEIGMPGHCAGLLSIKGLKEIDVKPDSSFIQNKVFGAIFYSPSGVSFAIRGKEAKVYVVDRAAFDKFLAEQASLFDVKLVLGTRVEKILFSKGAASGVLFSDGRHISSSLLIDAEGVGRSLLSRSGLERSKITPLPALQFELKGVEIDTDYVEIHLNRSLAPGFFIWVIPTSDNSVRVGLAGKIDVMNSLKSFVKKRFKNFEVVSIKSGMVTTSGPSKKTFWHGIIAVGDAAGQVKPTTGGGVITGGMCARIAGDLAAEAINSGVFSASFLKKYEVAWRSKLGKEFSTMLLARRVINAMSDESLEKVFQTIIQNRLTEVIEKFGDIDFQSSVLLKMATTPAVFRLLPDVFNAAVSGYFQSFLDA